MTGQVIIFAGSLAGVTLLVLAVWWLGLGPAPVIPDEASARLLAEDAICGFAACDVALDAAGHGALVSNGDGRIILLAPHGAHFAARLLDPASRAKRSGNTLSITTGEARFAPTSLDLGPAAAAWEQRLAALGG